MKLSKKGEYALRAMMALAESGGSSMTIAQVAQSQDLPKKFLEQILLSLKNAGLVVSRAGSKGGYILSKASGDISVREILNAVEEPISRAAAVVREVHEATQAINRVRNLVEEIRQHARTKLDRVSLGELVSENLPREDVEALMWYI